VLPDEFTYSGSSPLATKTNQTLSWNLTVDAGANIVLYVTGYAGQPGISPGAYPGGYYMDKSNDTTQIKNRVSLNHGTTGALLTDSYTTVVNQICDFSFAGLEGKIKMSTNSTFYYLVVVQNTGNVWDKYTLYVDPDNPEFADCTNPDGSTNTRNQKLFNQIQDLDGNPITETDWIAPGETFLFYLQLTTPPGTSANRWNCTDLVVTSTICGREKTETYHTNTINPSNDPDLAIYQVDYPDPVACDGTFKYTIFIVNLGSKQSYNTVVTDTYDPFVEFISSNPAPISGNNVFDLGQIGVNGFVTINITAGLKEGVTNNQLLENKALVTYDNGAQNPTYFRDSSLIRTTVQAFPDLLVTKTASANSLKLGQEVTYTLNVSNIGCDIATSVTIEDDFDEDHTTVINSGGGTVAGGKITWSNLNITPESGIQQFSYTVEVTDVECGSVQVTNDVFVSSFEPDRNILNNSASLSLLTVSAPDWTKFPINVAVTCTSIPTPAEIGENKDVWAVDACDRTVTVTYLGEVKTNGDCPNNYTLTRTWRAEDSDHNYSEKSQTITVQDIDPPDIICPGFSGYNTTIDALGNTVVHLEANSGYNYIVSGTGFNPSASDNCDANPILSYSLSGSTTGQGSDLDGATFNKGLTTVIWTAADQCGNISTCTFKVIVNADPGITLTKTLADVNGNSSVNGYSAVGDQLNYNITVTNTGDVVLHNLIVSDPAAVVNGNPVLTLNPLGSATFTAVHTVNQDDLDAGYITNTATVTATTASELTVEAFNSETVMAFQAGSATLSKISTTVPNNYDQVGETLTYSLIITNTGNVTLTNLIVTDPATSFAGSPVTSLGPGEDVTLDASHLVTQADLDNGKVLNTASVTGVYYDAQHESHAVTASGSTTIQAIQNGSVTLDKTSTVSPNNYDHVGEILTYTLIVRNNGNVTLTNLVVTDATATVSGGSIAYLAPNTSAVLSAQHTVTQADLDAGKVVNTASVTGNFHDADNSPQTATANDNVTIPAVQGGDMSIIKSSSTDPNSIDQIGDIISYDIIVTNTGNVTLSNIVVTDLNAVVSGGPVSTFAPGASAAFTATHTVTQADLDAGKVVNTASATGTFQDAINTPHTVATSDELIFIVTQAASISLNKVSTTNPNTYDEVGDILTYDIILTNTGNVTLTDLVITDPAATVTGSPVASLAPGSSVTVTASHTVTQADLDSEIVTNSATVNAKYYNSDGVEQTVTAIDFETSLALQSGAVTLSKVSTLNPNTYDQVGDILTYNIILSNTGNVTLSNLSVTDPNASVTGSPVASLAPGSTVTLSATHSVSQADLNAGKVVNTANVTATYTDAGSVVHTVYGSDVNTIIATQAGSVSMVKTSTTIPDNFDQVGDILTFNILLTNTGNVTLTNLVVIDPGCTLTGSPVASLAPGAQATVTASHTVTQADLNAGKFDNTANVSGAYRDANNVTHTATDSDVATVPAVQSPAVTIDKTSTTSPNNFDQPGDILTYSIVIGNTGNVTLTNLTVTDLIATVTGSPVASLAPGATANLTASYSVTQADIDAGKVVNTATVTGTYTDSGSVTHNVTSSDQVSIPALQTGSVTLDKTSATVPNTYDSVGDILTFNILISNTGNITLTDLVVNDPGSTITGSPISSIVPGNSVTVTATHVVTQDDIDQGIFENRASISGVYHDSNNAPHTVTANDVATIPATQNGSLHINKTSTTSPNNYDQIGDILTYTITISNTGNVTLSDLIVTDPNATVTGAPVPSLSPGATANFTASHVVTQGDIDAGLYLNSASVIATYQDHQNLEHPVSATGSATIFAIQNVAFSVTKTASQPTYDAINESIIFTIVITNTGNVTLTNMDVHDDRTGENWNIPVLGPGENMTYTTTYHITQNDLDAGSLTNTASVTGLDPDLNPVTVTDSETITAIQTVELAVTKTSVPTHYIPINENITYTINLVSTSNVNLSNVQVTDQLPEHTAFVSASNGGTYDNNTRTVTWNITQINPGQNISLQLVLSIDSDTEHQTLISNTVQVSNSQITATTSNTTEIEVIRSPVLWLVSSSDVTCFGGSNGSASVEISGGMPPFTFTWDTNPVQTGPDAINLPAGTYTVHAEDNLGFVDELAVTISQPQAALSAIPSITDVICYGASTGSVELQVNGGTSPYTFLWNNNAVTQNLTEVAAGNYSVTITDSNNCTATVTAEIKNFSEALTISNIDVEGVTCIDDPFGSIKYSITGGVPPYSYLWNTGAISMYLDDITGGDYQLTVTDSKGCQLVQEFTVDYQYTECEVKVPGGLTPYSQFDNQLIITGLGQYPNNSLKIYNRYGSLVYEAAPYQNDWDGVPNVAGNITEGDGKLPDGTYFYLLELEPGHKPMSGYIYLIKH